MILAPCADAGTAKNSVAPSAAIVTATLARIVPGRFRTLPASLGSAVGHTFGERDRRFPGTRGIQGCAAEFAELAGRCFGARHRAGGRIRPPQEFGRRLKVTAGPQKWGASAASSADPHPTSRDS